MTGRPVFVEPHGGDLHCVAILLAKLVCRERGHKEIPHDALKHKGLYPGIPDLYIEVHSRRTNGRGQATHDWTRYIIEVETEATAAAIRKKRAQFDTSLAGHELIVVDLKKCGSPNDIAQLRALLEVELP